MEIVGHRSTPGESIPGIDREVREGDELHLGALRARVWLDSIASVPRFRLRIEVGGHTACHIAYFFEQLPMALAGDCLFTMGCGRVFTQDFRLMQSSLSKLRELPDDTVLCGSPVNWAALCCRLSHMTVIYSYSM